MSSLWNAWTRPIGIFVLSAAVISSSAISATAAPGATGVSTPSTGLSAVDVQPINSGSQKVALGGAESPILTTAIDAPLDKSTSLVDLLKSPSPTAKKFDAAKATLVDRDERTDRYRDDAGNKWAVLSTAPKNVRDPASGSWRPLSESLKTNADGTVSAVAHPLAPAFAASSNSSKLMTVKRDKYTLSASLRGANSSRSSAPGIAGRALTEVGYADALPGVDLSYQLNAAAVTEQLKLDSAPGVAPRWVWHYSAPGLTVTTNKAGDIEFVSPTGAVVFSIPAPVMWDSSGIDGESSASYASVATTTVPTSDGINLVLEPEMAWLTAKERVYPVLIDPTINPGATDVHAYLSSGGTRLDRLWVGNSRAAGDTYWRSVVRYDFSSLAGKQVIAGRLDLGWAEGTTGSQNGQVQVANCFGYNCAGNLLSSFGRPRDFGQWALLKWGRY